MKRDEKTIWLARLRAWEEEKETNKHGMREYADQAIAYLKQGIGTRWPGALNLQRTKNV